MTFIAVAQYVDHFRGLTGSLDETAVVPEMLQFLTEFRKWQLSRPHINWREVVEALSLFGVLERLYGQHLQLTEMQKRDRQGKVFYSPVSLYLKRSEMVAIRADEGHFNRATAYIDEALGYARLHLGDNSVEEMHLIFERAQLYRDRGEYDAAARTLKVLRAALYNHHGSEKPWIAAAHKSLAIVQRESHHNLAALYNVWSADTYEQASEVDRTQIKRLMKQQVKHLISYAFYRSILALVVWWASGLIVDDVLYRFVISLALIMLLDKPYLSFFDWIFSMPVARWAGGPFANQWPAPQPMEKDLLENASNNFRNMRALTSSEPV